MSRTTVERFGRIWATTETPAPRQYLTHSLFVPYGWQARISLAAGHVCAQERRHLDLVDGSPDRVRFAPVIAALSSLSTANPVQWIFIEAPDGEEATEPEHAAHRRRAL